MIGGTGLLGTGSDSLEELEFLQDTTGSLSDCAQGVVGNMDRQTGLFGNQPVNASHKRSTSRHDYPPIHKIGGKLRGAALQGDANGLQNTRQRLLQGFADFF